MTRPDFEGDEAGRCGGCGSRNMVNTRSDGATHAVCMDCRRLQEIETRDWPEAQMCDNCAFRQGSPERADPYRWAEIMDTLDEGQPFHCHKGLEMTLKSDGMASFSPPSKQTGRVTVCAGWAASYMARFKRPSDEKGLA